MRTTARRRASRCERRNITSSPLRSSGLWETPTHPRLLLPACLSKLRYIVQSFLPGPGRRKIKPKNGLLTWYSVLVTPTIASVRCTPTLIKSSPRRLRLQIESEERSAYYNITERGQGWRRERLPFTLSLFISDEVSGAYFLIAIWLVINYN